jgi:hypothetical protein
MSLGRVDNVIFRWGFRTSSALTRWVFFLPICPAAYYPKHRGEGQN